MNRTVSDKGISVILPTLNEAKNLSFLVPEIIMEFENLGIHQFEILVIDDQSTDNTKETISNLQLDSKKISLISRKGNKSLPLSILDGINNSKYGIVAWLDADGSMPPSTLVKLAQNVLVDDEKVYIGSRFVQNGGYKGNSEANKNMISSLKNIYKSEDSILAVFLSKIFNNILNNIINLGVRDVTSGFIALNKKYINNHVFNSASYGDYFILLLKDLKSQNLVINEIGYICLTRKYGASKSGTSFIQLLKRSIPYLKASFLTYNKL
jgi:dolichol-phosphate mannosyltransferase